MNGNSGFKNLELGTWNLEPVYWTLRRIDKLPIVINWQFITLGQFETELIAQIENNLQARQVQITGRR